MSKYDTMLNIAIISPILAISISKIYYLYPIGNY